MMTVPKITYGQFYTCGAIPYDQWITIHAAFTMVVIGVLSSTVVTWANILTQSNPMYHFVHVTASSQITPYHHVSNMLSRVGPHFTQWNDYNFVTDMDRTDMGYRTGEQPNSMINS